MQPAFYQHDLSPFLIRFPEGWFIEGIRYYGLSYILGFLIGWGFFQLAFKRGRSPFNADQQFNLIFALILGVALGGRIGFILLYDLGSFLQNPLMIIKVWEGGMASHGGMIGVGIALWWFARSEKRPFFQVTDLVCVIGSAGIALGRLANYINGELWGRVTEVSWAVRFREPDILNGQLAYGLPRHPSQLYQAAMEGLLLLIFMQVRFWFSKTPPRFGRLTAEYLVGYAILRMIGEIWREPDAGLILGMSRGTFYSVFLFGVAGWCYFHSRKQDRHPQSPAASST